MDFAKLALLLKTEDKELTCSTRNNGPFDPRIGMWVDHTNIYFKKIIDATCSLSDF